MHFIYSIFFVPGEYSCDHRNFPKKRVAVFSRQGGTMIKRKLNDLFFHFGGCFIANKVFGIGARSINPWKPFSGKALLYS